MGVHITRHARNRMRLYEVTEDGVRAALTNPEQVIAGAFGAQQAWKRGAQGTWLRVTFKDEGTRRVVITVTPKRLGPGGRDVH